MNSDARVRLYLGTDHACGYLEDRTARSLFIDPKLTIDARRYGVFVDLGFRRSGDYVYRPHCLGCGACIPARIPVFEFQASRAQRRCRRANEHLSLDRGADLDDEHYDLYRRYLRLRHPSGGMDADNDEAFRSFLGCRWQDPEVWSIREHGRLVAGAVVDVLPQGLSAVYTYFDPAMSRRSLGTYAVLRQIEEACADGLRYVYLGYWVPGSATMDYKIRFRPLEVLENGHWRRVAAQPPNDHNGALSTTR